MVARLGGLPLALVLLAVGLQCASALPAAADVLSMGDAAEEALMGLDDDEDSETPQGDLGETADVGEALGAWNASTAVVATTPKPEPKAEARPKVFKPMPVTPETSAADAELAVRTSRDMVTKLQAAQSEASEALVKARTSEEKADSLYRLASVKEGARREALETAAWHEENKAKALREKAKVASKKAYEMKMAMKEDVAAKLEDAQTKMADAAFAAHEAAVAKAQADTEMAAAKMKKPVSHDPCVISFEKSVKDCDLELERQKGLKEMLESKMEKENKYCKAQAEEVKQKCQEEQVKEAGAATKAKMTMEMANTVHGELHVARSTARALARYKDVVPPEKPDGPTGLFSYNHLVYLVNKDGTKTWVRFPIRRCHRATPGVVPQQFPTSKTKPEFNTKESIIACDYAPYEGKGNPDFYKNCECAGMYNKKGHGAHCSKWGFKFNWCYVVKDCAYGNTAFSEEVKNAKVLVGCNIPDPKIANGLGSGEEKA